MTDDIVHFRLHQQAFAPTLAALQKVDDVALWPLFYARPEHVSWLEFTSTGVNQRLYSFLSSQSFTVMITCNGVLMYQSTVYVSETRLDVYVTKNDRGWRMDTLTFPRALGIVKRYIEDARLLRQQQQQQREQERQLQRPRLRALSRGPLNFDMN